MRIWNAKLSYQPLIRGISSTPRSLQWNHFSYSTSEVLGTNQRTQSVSLKSRRRSITKPQLSVERWGECGIFAGNRKNSPSLMWTSLWTPFSKILTQASPLKYTIQSLSSNKPYSLISTFDLIEKLFSLLNVIVLPVIRSANKHDYQLSIMHELVTDRRQKWGFIFFDPVGCIDDTQSCLSWHFSNFNFFQSFVEKKCNIKC